ncbi:MAG: SPW repeat protein [Geminicoccaceae bacterium]
MNTSVGKSWFTEHRRWEDFCSAGLGVLILLSPGLLGANVGTAIVISAGLTGVLITMIALLEIMSLRRWEELLELVCGLWVVASPIVFGYGGALRLSHFVLGAAVVVLALLELWQDRNRQLTD